MRFTENDEIESELYDEFLAIDLTEQKNLKDIIIAQKKRLKEV